jgi:hypothetical protein
MLWEYVYIGSEMVRNSIVGLCHTWPTKESQGKTNHNVPKPVRDVRKNSPTKASASKKKDTRKGTTLLEEARGLGIFLALEPRIMFDGAALLTGAEVIQDATAQDQTVFPGIDGETSTDTNTNDFAAPSDRKEIVFIDTRVEDYQTLMEGIDPNADVILLDSTRDGVEQIAEVLAGRNDIDAIHLIAEGNEAELHLGSEMKPSYIWAPPSSRKSQSAGNTPTF